MRQFLKKYRNVLIGFLIVVIVASAFIFVRRSNAGTANQFQTATIGRDNLITTIGTTGTVRAKQTAVLIWQAAGTVETVNVQVGDSVSADEILASLAKTSLPQSVILAEADLVDAQKALDDLLSSDTALAQAEIDLKVAQEAYEKAENYLKYLQLSPKVPQTEIRFFLQQRRWGWEYISKTKSFKGPAPEDWITDAEHDLALKTSQLDDAQREFDRLNNGNMEDIAAAQARVEAAQATLNLARVISPFAGTVTESYPLPGDQVNAGANAFRLDDLTSLLVDVEVSEVDINSVEIGQPVTLSFDAILGKEYHGEVLKVAQTGTSVQGVVNFQVTVELIDADEDVKPGMTAAVTITISELEDVLLVPNRAARLVDGSRVVYLLVDGQPVQTEVSLGASSDTMSVLVNGDVKEGDIIILNPSTESQGGPNGGPVREQKQVEQVAP
ncbi:MAG TPA: efflux RND transporter periplasmic adaptor subunit [Anaerolineales bacterium]|nr:efflux RND transporter periplasmic adaptor subunit [Anaerolineales bacterium]